MVIRYAVQSLMIKGNRYFSKKNSVTFLFYLFTLVKHFKNRFFYRIERETFERHNFSPNIKDDKEVDNSKSFSIIPSRQDEQDIYHGLFLSFFFVLLASRQDAEDLRDEKIIRCGGPLIMKKLINMKLFSIVPSRQDEQDTRAFSFFFFFCTFNIQAGCRRFERDER